MNNATLLDDVDITSTCRRKWRLCSVNQVEEVKLVIRLIPIWLSCLMFSAAMVQIHTFFTKQASTMTRSIGAHFILPPAFLQSLVGLAIFISVSVYDLVFVPFARKITGHPSGITVLQRIGVGLFLSILCMVISALIESKRISTAKYCNLMDTPKVAVPIRVWWLLPQHVISGIAEMFTIVGLQEIFYDQMPEGMRSFGAAAYMSVIGVGSFINNIIISIVQTISSKHGDKWLIDNLNRAHLDYFYWVMAGLGTLNLCIYIWISRGFVYKKVHFNSTEDEEMEL